LCDPKYFNSVPILILYQYCALYPPYTIVKYGSSDFMGTAGA
jgi:hypothetical protein